MASFDASDFDALCREPAVAEQIATIEARRAAAVRRFRLTLLGGLAAAAAIALAIGSLADSFFGIAAMMFLGVFAVILALRPLAAASEGIKHPTLEALAARCGMSFTAAGFEPPVFDQARGALFGTWISSAAFTDLFYAGGRGDSGRFAFYEGALTRGHGKHRRQIFSGQIYAFERRRTGRGEIVAVPDRGLFNLFMPAGGFQRVRIEGDDPFEKAFEVYATDPVEARFLLGGMTARRLILELRQAGKLFLYVGPEDVLVAISGTDRYEPGSMFSARTGEARVRLMFDDVAAALDIVRKLQGAFG